MLWNVLLTYCYRQELADDIWIFFFQIFYLFALHGLLFFLPSQIMAAMLVFFHP